MKDKYDGWTSEEMMLGIKEINKCDELDFLERVIDNCSMHIQYVFEHVETDDEYAESVYSEYPHIMDELGELMGELQLALDKITKYREDYPHCLNDVRAKSDTERRDWITCEGHAHNALAKYFLSLQSLRDMFSACYRRYENDYGKAQKELMNISIGADL